jgi:outer membrane protein assembly factor BamB
MCARGRNSVRRPVLASYIALAGAGVLAAALAVPARADNLMFRGGTGLTGSYAEKISLPLAMNWRYTTAFAPYNTSSPAVAGDTVYFAGGNRVYAVSAESGSLKWQFPADQPLSTLIASSPAVVDNTVFFGALDGKLYALRSDSGKQIWAFDTRSTIGSSPTVVDGVVYFGSGDGRVWGIDAKTGDPSGLWKGGLKSTDEITGAPAVANGFVYALSLDQNLHAIGSATAKERWQVRVPGSVLNKSPVAAGEYVYVANGPNIHCFSGRSGVMRWVQNLNSDVSVTPAVSDDGIFVVTNDGRVRSFDTRTGRPRWKVEPKLDFDVVAPPMVTGGTVVIGTTEGGVYAVDGASGEIKWTYRLMPSSNNTDTIGQAANIAAAPVISDGTVYVVSNDGLSAFRSDATDSMAPIISDTEPDMGIVINGAPPIWFEAKIVDEGSGINPASVKISLDGVGIARRPEGRENDDKPGYKFDIHDNVLEYQTIAPTGASTVVPLAEGKHTVTVTASDWMGNVATRSWSFTVDNSISRRYVRKRDARAAQNRGGGMMGGPGGGKGSSGYPGGGGRGGGGRGGRGPGGG